MSLEDCFNHGRTLCPLARGVMLRRISMILFHCSIGFCTGEQAFAYIEEQVHVDDAAKQRVFNAALRAAWGPMAKAA